MKYGKRDKNEGAVRRRAEALGFLWLENNASTKGRPDACLLRNGQTYWCEVKEPEGSFTPAQVEEFPRLIAKGVPVYVLTAPMSVDFLVRGVLRPWSPSDVKVVRSAKGRQKTKRAHRPGYDRARTRYESCFHDFCATSCLPGRRGCHSHDPWPETATVEDDLLPAPRRKRACTCDHDDIPFCAVHTNGGADPRKGVSGRKRRVAP